MRARWAFAAAAVAGCSSILGIERFESTDANTTIDAPASVIDAPASVIDVAMPDADLTPDAPPGQPDAPMPDGGGVTLTVKNFLSWCSVSVNGGGASTNATQSVTVSLGTQVQLTHVPAGTFILGKWHHTDGDLGGGEAGNVVAGVSHAVKTVNGDACVWVCCPFSDGTGCPAADQCP